MDQGLSEWLGTLASYLYVADLVEDKEILELGCGTGLGCEFLANHGAKRILGIDRDRDRVAEARLRHALVNVEYRVSDLGGLELEDESFDLVFAHGETALRKPSLVHELRRVLRPDGVLVWLASSADRLGARGGVSYHEFADRLGSTFGPPRMIAIQPLIAMSLVEYVDLEPELELDTSLARLGRETEQVTGYLALFGEARARVRPYAVVQLPSLEGLRVAEGVLGVGASDAEKLRAELETERRERHRAQSQLSDLRIRVTELERSLAAKATLSAGIDRELAFDADLASSLGTAPSSSTTPTSSAIAEALDAHFANVRALEAQIRELREYVDEVEDERETFRARIRKLEDELGAERARVTTMRVQMGEWRDRTARAEGELLGVRIRQPDAQSTTALEVGPALERLGEAERLLDQQRALAAELARGLDDVARDAAKLEAERASEAKSAWSEAPQHRLSLLSTELGTRDAEIMLLTVGLRALKDRLGSVADELERAIDGGELALVRERAAKIAAQLRAFATN